MPRLAESYKASITSQSQPASDDGPVDIQDKMYKAEKTEIQKNVSYDHATTEFITDSTLKSNIIFTASHSFAWTVEDSSPTSIAPTQTDTNTNSDPTGNEVVTSFSQRFNSSLFYYHYPSAVPGGLLTPAQGQAAEVMEETLLHQSNPYMACIRKYWTQALENAAKMALAVEGRSFTMYTRQFAVQVTNSKTSGPVACINRTTVAFRRKLKQATIEFSLPLATEGDRVLDDGRVIPVSEQPLIDNTSQSFSIIRGRSPILRLIAFFVEAYNSDTKWLGTCPSIVSFFPFLHGSLSRLEVSTSASKLIQGTSFENVDSVSVSGIITPEAFREICASIHDSLEEDQTSKMKCTTIQQTEWCGSAIAMTKNPTSPDSSPLHFEEYNGLGCIASASISPGSLLYICTVKR